MTITNIYHIFIAISVYFSPRYRLSSKVLSLFSVFFFFKFWESNDLSYLTEGLKYYKVVYAQENKSAIILEAELLSFKPLHDYMYA